MTHLAEQVKTKSELHLGENRNLTQHSAEQPVPWTVQPDLPDEQVNTASAGLRDGLGKKIPGDGDKGIRHCKCCKIKLETVHLPFLGVKEFLKLYRDTTVFVCAGSSWYAPTLGPGQCSFQSDRMPDLCSKRISNSEKPSGSVDLLFVCLTNGQLCLTLLPAVR